MAHRNKMPRWKLDRARGMRQGGTRAEAFLWEALRREQLGVKFRRQAPLYGFIADFWSPALGLVIEVDGPIHDKDADARRDAILASYGIRTLRFANADVELRRAGVVIPRIAEAIADMMSAGMRRRTREEIEANDHFRAVVLEAPCLFSVTRPGHVCHGKRDPHHLIEAQFLRAHFSTLEGKWALIFDPDIGVPLCRSGFNGSHEDVTLHNDYVFIEEVPARAVDWARAWGIEHRLERECPSMGESDRQAQTEFREDIPF